MFSVYAYELFNIGYPLLHYSAKLHYVPWDIWLEKSHNHEFHWLHKETTVEN